MPVEARTPVGRRKAWKAGMEAAMKIKVQLGQVRQVRQVRQVGGWVVLWKSMGFSRNLIYERWIFHIYLGLLDGSLSREACRMTYSILFRYCRSAHVKF